MKSSENIISGVEVEAFSHRETSEVVESPRLYGTTVTVLHRGAVGAVLQTADGQTWLGDDVKEGVPLRWVRGRHYSDGKPEKSRS